MAVLLAADRFDESTIPSGVRRLRTLTDWWFRGSLADPVGRLIPYGNGRFIDLGRFEQLLGERVAAGETVALDIEPGRAWCDPTFPWFGMDRASSAAERSVRMDLIVLTLEAVGALWRFGLEVRPDLDWRVYGIWPLRDLSWMFRAPEFRYAESLPVCDWLTRSIVGFDRSGLSLYRWSTESDERWARERASLLARASASGLPFDVWVNGFMIDSGAPLGDRVADGPALAAGAPGFRDVIYWCSGGVPEVVGGKRVFADFAPHAAALAAVREYHEVDSEPQGASNEQG